jgi:hypothetical protein
MAEIEQIDDSNELYRKAKYFIIKKMVPTVVISGLMIFLK